jgi:hypothetical protein
VLPSVAAADDGTSVVQFKLPNKANEGLRTGGYGKTLTFNAVDDDAVAAPIRPVPGAGRIALPSVMYGRRLT